MNSLTLTLVVAVATLAAAVPHSRQERQVHHTGWPTVTRGQVTYPDASTSYDTSDNELTQMEAIQLMVRAMPSVMKVFLKDSDSTTMQKMRDMTVAILPAVRETLEERARSKGRTLTTNESDRMRNAEELVPVVMQSVAEIMDGFVAEPNYMTQ